MTNKEKLNEITETAKQMILSGVLLKNVKKHFTNLGVSLILAEKLCRIAEIEANEWQLSKAK